MMQITHHISEEEIALAAELIIASKREQLPKSIQIHLDECDQCAVELMTVMELLEDQKLNEKEEEYIPQVKKKNNYLIWYWTAGIAAVLLITLFFLKPSNNSNPTTPIQFAEEKETEKTEEIDANIKVDTTPLNPIAIEKSKPTVTNTKKEVQTNKKFENQIIEYQNTYRDEGFKLISSVYLEISKHKNIQWESSEEEFIIEWWSIDEKLILEQNTSKNSIVLPELDKGTYYFKLLNSDFDVLAVGRLVN